MSEDQIEIEDGQRRNYEFYDESCVCSCCNKEISYEPIQCCEFCNEVVCNDCLDEDNFCKDCLVRRRL